MLARSVPRSGLELGYYRGSKPSGECSLLSNLFASCRLSPVMAETPEQDYLAEMFVLLAYCDVLFFFYVLCSQLFTCSHFSIVKNDYILKSFFSEHLRKLTVYPSSEQAAVR